MEWVFLLCRLQIVIINVFFLNLTLHLSMKMHFRTMTNPLFSDHFDVMLHRFNAFMSCMPCAIDAWLSGHRDDEVIVTTIDSVCFSLFRDVIHSDEAESKWKLDVCRCAVRTYLSRARGVEMTSNLTVRIPLKEFTHPASIDPLPLPDIDYMSRVAVLETRLLELECDLGGSTKARKVSLPSTPASVCAYLMEKRAQAITALASLKTYKRKRELHATGSNSRVLKADESPILEPAPILPKRAFSLAGYWNIEHNDLLAMTPVLVDEVESRGGRVIRRKGMNVCFSAQDKNIVKEAAAEVVSGMRPEKYACRGD